MNNAPRFEFVVLPDGLDESTYGFMSPDRYMTVDYMYEQLTGCGLTVHKDFEVAGLTTTDRSSNRKMAKVIAFFSQEAFTLAKVALG